MSVKKIILAVLAIIIASGAYYAWKEFNRKNKDLSKAKPDFTITAVELISAFESNDSAASRKYNGKILEVNGRVKKIEKDDKGYYTVILGDTSGLSSVRCSMDTMHQLDAASVKEGASAMLRGACTGFNKDELGLGSDVILNRCAVIKKD